jgi:hypothetical protein
MFPPEADARVCARALSWFGALLAVCYVAIHVPFSARTPDDIDGVNFALNAERLAVAADRPQLTGHPLFVAAGRAVAAIDWRVRPDERPAVRQGRALALVSALGGGLAALAACLLYGALGTPPAVSRAAAVIAVSCPLFWFTGIRPMSDLPGLAAALASQALGIQALLQWLDLPADRPPPAPLVRRMIASALLAGIAPGLQAVSLWLAAPVLVGLGALALWRRQRQVIAALGLAFCLGIELWAVPLVIAVDGTREYAWALTVPRQQDFYDAVTLSQRFDAGLLVQSLRHTFLLPWEEPWLGLAVLVTATAGAIHLLWRRPRVLAVLGLATVPYLLVHLAYHETFQTRHALPLGPAVALLSASGLYALVPRAFPYLVT